MPRLIPVMTPATMPASERLEATTMTAKRRSPFRASVVLTMAGFAPLAAGCDEMAVSHNPPLPRCPAEPPEAGTDCFRPEGLECGYNPCLDYDTIVATCTGGAWDLRQATCNPPPPDEDGGDDAGDDAGN